MQVSVIFVMSLQKMNKVIISFCSAEAIVMLNKTGVSVTLVINFS